MSSNIFHRGYKENSILELNDKDLFDKLTKYKHLHVFIESVVNCWENFHKPPSAQQIIICDKIIGGA